MFNSFPEKFWEMRDRSMEELNRSLMCSQKDVKKFSNLGKINKNK
tara:strand:+ start:235 stop:369 length:135 start_codon:yes stop_codon:yes gene_type:complete